MKMDVANELDSFYQKFKSLVHNKVKASHNPIYTGEGWFHPPKQSDALLGMKERSEEAVTIL